jgi:hypothetical protein
MSFCKFKDLRSLGNSAKKKACWYKATGAFLQHDWGGSAIPFWINDFLVKAQESHCGGMEFAVEEGAALMRRRAVINQQKWRPCSTQTRIRLNT